MLCLGHELVTHNGRLGEVSDDNALIDFILMPHLVVCLAMALSDVEMGGVCAVQIRSRVLVGWHLRGFFA